VIEELSSSRDLEGPRGDVVQVTDQRLLHKPVTCSREWPAAERTAAEKMRATRSDDDGERRTTRRRKGRVKAD
jgi:hypothetical protein